VIRVGGKKVKVATIDTMLSFYLAFTFADKPYYDKERILCMSQYLFAVQARNRLEQKGVLRRFSVTCYGKQDTLEDIRGEKAELFKKLSKNRGSLEWDKVFLRYSPAQDREKKEKEKEKKKKARRRNRTKNEKKKKKRQTKKKGLFGF
jgi:hypothetical protein